MNNFINPDKPASAYPTYRFQYPRPAYSVDPSPYYDHGPSDADEAIVTNGTFSASMPPNGLHSGYIPSRLWRFNAPPFTFGETRYANFEVWAFDDLGPHQAQNIAFELDFNLKGLTARLNQVDYEGRTDQGWHVSFDYTPIPEKRILVAAVSYTNVGERPRPLKLAGHLKDPQITYSLGWTQYTPAPGRITASFNSRTGFGAIETGSTSSNAFLVFGLDRQPDSYAVTTEDERPTWCSGGTFGGRQTVVDAAHHDQYAAASFREVAPGQTVKLSMVIAIGGTLEEARADFVDTITHLADRLTDAERYWSRRWTDAKYEIATPDRDIDRMSEIAMMNGILGMDPVNRAWITSSGRAFRGVTFIWDQAYSNYGFLTGGSQALVKDSLRSSLNLDLTAYNFYGVADRRPLGYHYSYSHYSITSLVYKYVTLSGDSDFLSERLDNGRTVLENLAAQAEYIAYGIAFDFGAPWELLECVDHYVHDIPDLTANTCWMADKIRALAVRTGRMDLADRMGPVRSQAYNKLQTLWDADAGWFRTHGGHLTYSCQVMLCLLSGVLSREQFDSLMAKMGDFIGPHGVKSLASYDVDYVAESRGDFNGPASYSGTPAEFANILHVAGDRERLHRFAEGLSRWWQWRPFQPQGIDSETGNGVGLITYEGTNNCASAYMAIVPFYMVGLRPALGGIDIFDCYPAEWTNANAAGRASFNGNNYSAMISISYRNYKITCYADKPVAGPGRYSHASVYDAEGRFLKQWQAQRLPVPDQDLTFVLHFDSSKPMLSGVDEITTVADAGDRKLTLENRHSDLAFTLNTEGKLAMKIAVRGAANAVYSLFVNDDKQPDVATDASGYMMLNHEPQGTADRLQLQLHASIPNLALHRNVEADSARGVGHEPQRMVDGNDATCWTSGESELPHWAKIDLGAAVAIRCISIDWGAAFGTNYKLQVSVDGIRWTLVAAETDNGSPGIREFAFAPLQARYIRIYSALGNKRYIRIRSVKVFRAGHGAERTDVF